MLSFLKFYETAHAYVEQSGYADALVYFDNSLRELERYGLHIYCSKGMLVWLKVQSHNVNVAMCRHKSNPDQSDPYARGKIQSLWEALKEEIAQVKDYQRKLLELDRAVYNSKAASSSNQWTPREVVQRQPHREPPTVDNSQWAPRVVPQPPPRRQVERPNRAPTKPPVPRAQRQPDVKGAAPKVNSGRGNGRAKQKAQQQDAEPWESWEGQDKELAANLANDIMDASPGIRWDDIAGLHDAKRILQACLSKAIFTESCIDAGVNLGVVFNDFLAASTGGNGSSPPQARAVCWDPETSKRGALVWASRNWKDASGQSTGY
jgi:hypothetical protein